MNWRFRRKPQIAAPRRVGQAADERVAAQDGRIDQLEKTLGSLKSAPTHLDESRSKIAFKFVKWYFIFISIILIGTPLYNAWIGKPELLDVSKLLNQIATLLGTPLGFVVGYYFKEKGK